MANKNKVAALKRYCKKRKLKLYEISAVTGKGIEELKFAIAKEVEALREKSLAGGNHRYAECLINVPSLSVAHWPVFKAILQNLRGQRR